MELQPATIRDLSALRKLEKACFEKDAWPVLDLIAVLTWPEVIRIKAVEEGLMVGFIAGEPRSSKKEFWIATVAVDPRYQRRGIGRQLLRACEKQAKLHQLKLTVRISNQAAISLYEQEGYRTMDIWKSYYVDGEDGLVMGKVL
jgi:ribosomal protein S18 acetylase RimI-like enzyme